VDVELFTFVERYATNLLRWELLLFLGNHLDACLSPAEFARAVRRRVTPTTKELDDLTYLRVLTRRYTPQSITYQLARKASVRRAVARLAAYARGEAAAPEM
jgi:hypothetical protein